MASVNITHVRIPCIKRHIASYTFGCNAADGSRSLLPKDRRGKKTNRQYLHR